MEKTALKSLLTSLCANSPWKYAVFWKLNHTLLRWEDGYCEYSKRVSFGHQAGVSDRSCMDFSIGFAIGYMSCLQYALGEGVIGRAALTGDDSWVFFQNSSKPEFPEEWNLQVPAGIETILLVPLLPHGVLQLGSFDKVDEDPSVASEIKEIFNSSLYKGSSLQYALPSAMQFEDSEVIFTEKVVHDHLSNYSEPISLFAVHNIPVCSSSFDPLNLSDLVGQHTNTEAQETMCDFLTFSYMDDTDEVINCSLLYGENDGDVGLSEDTFDGIYTSPTVAGTLFGFPVDCFPEENDHISWDFCDPNYEDLISNFDPSPWEYSGYFDDRDHEELLQDVVPSIFEQSDDVNSCTVLSSVSSVTSLVKNAASSSSSALSLSEEPAEESAPAPPPPKRKKHSHGPSVGKKARTNNGSKPRPKDRQLIQDRLKELRDLVPKGEKCSIDSLLDKAIKSMQFLTNVSEQAEKLRHGLDKEILDGENLIEANNQKGSSSAVQDLKLYPVTVKDLSRPGTMLIEMVCNEEELFFEITKVLSHLGLTILKSIMETNSGNNTSAKFIVEAPRGFPKMEIFFSLMQLLQRRRY